MALGYSLTAHYGGQGLLDSFSFFTGNDPSHGFVDYQSKEDALANNLVSIGHDYNNVRLGVDSNNTYSISDKGRPSVRLTSHDTFTHGLFIADIYHMPASTCGTWPAFWAFNNQDDGANWPAGGEIEIIEGANTAERNLFSTHTTEGCHAPRDGFIGQQGRKDCSPDPENIGCNYATPASDTTSYGDAFNAEGGGVYALKWDSQDLKLWHFPRSTIPDNIIYGHVVGPDPSSWGPPQAVFGGSSCSPDTYFYNLSLVLNINFCGDYAGNIWGKADQCNLLAPTCEEFVANNPESFQEAYWDINYIDVYQWGPLSNMTIPPLPSDSAPSVTSSTISDTPAPSSVIPTHTRTITLSTVRPTETDSSLAGPATINDYTVLGCFQSNSGYPSFSQAASHPGMDNEVCVGHCAGKKYAGVFEDTCYCADNLGDARAVENSMCDVPCSGNGHEVCGGHFGSTRKHGALSLMLNSTLPVNSSTHHPRDIPSSVLMTVYGNLTDEPMPPPAPAMGGTPKDSYSTIPAPNTTVTTGITVTYTTICSTNLASLVEVEYSTTVTYEECGCTKSKSRTGHHSVGTANHTMTSLPPQVITAVPMTTYAETCQACGPHGESTVTLTVPKAVVTKVITSVAVHTVVPIITYTTPTYGTGAVFTPIPKPTSSPSNAMPLFSDASPGRRAAAALEMLGWGVAVWFGLFGFMLVL
ncbi:glycoside hydrolase family 16 protein [Hypoxylon sp. FL1857]|nr:glycoside hydrolase family 16 protein [Hypoxylon sp. FL1857]